MQSHLTPSPDPDPTIERWLPVVGYEGHYEVSSFGRVCSIARKCSAGRRRKERILRPGKKRRGYLFVVLCKDAVRSNIMIHTLVAAAFLGDRPEGYTVNHIDGDVTRNRPENLEYLTMLENLQHAARTGLLGKLSKEQVWEVREFYEANPQAEYGFYATKFGVSRGVISNIVKGRSYSDIPTRQGDPSRPILRPPSVTERLAGVDVIALRDSGRSLNSIAREFGVSWPSVLRYARKQAAT